jgi:hypothetical protein
VGPRAVLAPPGFDPQTVQPVASSYTDCAIPVPHTLSVALRIHKPCLFCKAEVPCLFHLKFSTNLKLWFKSYATNSSVECVCEVVVHGNLGCHIQREGVE